MLTGDKLETAVSIGISCGLLDDTFERVVIDSTNLHELKNIESHNLNRKYALIITGEALFSCLQKTEHKESVNSLNLNSLMLYKISFEIFWMSVTRLLDAVLLHDKKKKSSLSSDPW